MASYPMKAPFAWRNLDESGGICERKTLFRMKKEADQAGFKVSRTRPWWLSSIEHQSSKQQRTTAAFILYSAWKVWKERNWRIFKDQQELQLRCLLQQEKKRRYVDRPVDALGLTNESPLSCFSCVLFFLPSM